MLDYEHRGPPIPAAFCPPSSFFLLSSISEMTATLYKALPASFVTKTRRGLLANPLPCRRIFLTRFQNLMPGRIIICMKEPLDLPNIANKMYRYKASRNSGNRNGRREYGSHQRSPPPPPPQPGGSIERVLLCIQSTAKPSINFVEITIATPLEKHQRVVQISAISSLFTAPSSSSSSVALAKRQLTSRRIPLHWYLTIHTVYFCL